MSSRRALDTVVCVVDHGVLRYAVRGVTIVIERAEVISRIASMLFIFLASGCPASGKSQTAGNGASGSVAPPGVAGTQGNLSTAGASAGAGAEPAVTFTMIYNGIIVSSGCIAGPTCHASDAGGKLTMLEQSKAYANLVGVPAMGTSTNGTSNCADSGLLRVKPGDPENSLLIKKLEGSPPCGMAMPVGGMLKPEQVAQIRSWIQAGANND